MPSKFNTLLLGESEDVVAILDGNRPITNDELRLALVNAHNRIARLESSLASLSRDVRQEW